MARKHIELAEMAGSRPRRQRDGGVTGTTEFDSGPPVDSAPPFGREHVGSASGAVGMTSMDVDHPACEGARAMRARRRARARWGPTVVATARTRWTTR